MSDFYSRCLWCDIDLPRGLAFCTPTHREWWTRQHRDTVAVPKTVTDEIGNTDVRERSSAEHGTARQQAASGETRSQEGTPAVCSGWDCHDPKCTHPNCRPAF